MRKRNKMSIEEIHENLFDVLVEIDRILSKENIEYYLIFGTLLGCIRDGSPIKWDDDVDICIKEKDWKRANELLIKGLNYNKFFLLNKKIKEDYPDWRFITRVGVNGTYRRMDYYKDASNQSGIFIDIFQLTSVPDNTFLQKIWEYKLGIIDGIINLHSLHQGAYPNPYIISRLIYMITKNKKGICYWNGIRYKIQTQYCRRLCDYITVPFGPYGVYPLRKAKYRTESFKNSERKPFNIKDGNGIVKRTGMFPVPSGYNEILSITYGNWNKRPLGRVMPNVSFWEE